MIYSPEEELERITTIRIIIAGRKILLGIRDLYEISN